MRKVWLLLSLLAIIILAACSASSTAIPVVTEGPKVTPTTAQVSQPSQAPAAVATTGPASCVVKGTLPTLSPTETARFAPVSDKDWTMGPADAKVTILEYSDYM